MANVSTMVNPYAFGMNPYTMGMANFANQYAATDAESFYNTSIFHPLMGGYGAFGCMDPGLMGMMGMYGGMMGMNPMMNPMFMMNRMMNPATYDAMNRGINPMGGLYFNQGKEFQRYNTQQSTIANGIDSLAVYANNDNQDDFKATYNKMLATEKQRLRGLIGSSYSEVELTKAAKANINQAFQAKYNVSLSQALEMCGDSPFKQGMKDLGALGGLLSDKETVSQNIAMVNDAPLDSSQRKREKHAQAFGFGAAAAGATYAGIGACTAISRNSKIAKDVATAVKALGEGASKEAIKSATKNATTSALAKYGSRLKGFGKPGLIAAAIVGAAACAWSWLKD